MTGAAGVSAHAELWSAPIDRVRAIAAAPRTEPPPPRSLSWPALALRQFLSPVTLILVMAAAVATAVGDATDGIIIGVIVLASAGLGFAQEFRASRDVRMLLASVSTTVDVDRGGEMLTLVLADVRTGDELQLSAGDIVPGDCRLVSAQSLVVDESALTGESVPVDKSADTPLTADTPLAARTNCLFRGTHVVSGTGVALVVYTGRDTEFGAVAARLMKHPAPTAFEHGLSRFGILLLQVTIALTIAVFVINLVLGRPILDALLFSLALAVGVTPQMLPAIVSVSLSAGARALSRHHVIVKRLDVIEDLGSLTVLCTDKTGTLTGGTVEFSQALAPDGTADARLLELGALNSLLQKGYRNPLDDAILRVHQPAPGESLGEVPYDFARKRLSIGVQIDGTPTLVTKGSLESVLAACTSIRGDRSPTAFELVRDRYRALGADGFRAIGIATRPLDAGERIGVASEAALDFAGILTFRDDVKDDVNLEIADLSGLGVRVVMVSGDNRFVSRSVASRIGLRSELVVTGAEIDRMSPARLRRAVTECDVFAEVEPRHKEEIVAALKAGRRTVGFLGDGINDSSALHAADVGISVDEATDVAREAAAIVLTEKSLAVVADGVRLGRRTFANTLKYVRFASSSNFGNVLSMVIASAVLPFLPMLPGQILLLNFLADLPSMLLSRDRVDPERLERPGSWNLRSVRRFMIVFGALSTLFDLATFALLITVFHASESLFQSGWFIESALTQMIVLVTLRTRRAFFRSRPDTLFGAAVLAIALLTLVIPFLPLAAAIGFTAPPFGMVALLFALAAVYLGSLELVKRAPWSGFDRGAAR
ncbi:magnesium-translocating P-type ATPase [Glaciihabitans sp. INWT7]|uniref:magnesium-translocating P-type ATPase n=1 Tax=Glaciihabitans sp. INWT7 TaxID=2596912 RepID=UPI001623A215|nr:magnesium-translocating P-type ATPase [Glaciihabitans sp. INWT7]QNE46724.1 magnesium-translocating P-type ATPase [Glaciihabitans sp. INWT7]